MTKVILVHRKSGEIIKEVHSNRVQWSIDQLMRNRDPREYVARECYDEFPERPECDFTGT